jgi:hypothetical protein
VSGAPGQYEGLQNELLETRQRAADLDERRQSQIQHQRESIDRLLVAAGVSDAEVAAHEIARLCEQLAIQDAKLAAVRRYAELLEHPATRTDLLRLIGSQ